MVVRVLKVIGLVLLAGVLGAFVWMAWMFTGFSGADEAVLFVVGFFAPFIAGLIIGVISPK